MLINRSHRAKFKVIALLSLFASILYVIHSLGILFGETAFYSSVEHLMFILYGISSYSSCAWVTNKIVYDDKAFTSNAIIQIILISSIINAVLTTVIFFLTRLIAFTYLGLGMHNWIPPITGIAMNIAYTFVLIHLIIAGLYLVYLSIQISHRASLKQFAAEKENATAQFKLLQQQISPHFLFNNLNVLAGLIPLDAKLAEQYVTKFANLYRFILKHKDEELISLTDELDFVRQYCQVMNIRFDNAYPLVIEQSKTIESALIAPGALQTCIENAIKHNIASTSSPLSITVNIDDKVVSIENSLRLKTNVKNSTKTGLANLSKRYQSLSDIPVSIENTNDVFKVSIPLVTLSQHT
jgi:sensor histidine kinase YesM